MFPTVLFPGYDKDADMLSKELNKKTWLMFSIYADFTVSQAAERAEM